MKWALCIAVALSLALPCRVVFAGDSSEIEALKARIEALEAENAVLKGRPANLDVSRFDGEWKGEITRDPTKSCPEGEIKVTVKAGKMDGFRWIRSQPAPAKGTISPDGSFEGYTNRSVMLGKFDGSRFDGYYPDQECPNRKIVMFKVS